MPKKRLTPEKCQVPLLSILKKLSNEDRKLIISRLDERSIDNLSSVVYNTIKCDFKYKPGVKKRLRKKLNPHASDLRFISDANKPWKKRQSRLVKQSGRYEFAFLLIFRNLKLQTCLIFFQWPRDCLEHGFSVNRSAHSEAVFQVIKPFCHSSLTCLDPEVSSRFTVQCIWWDD